MAQNAKVNVQVTAEGAQAAAQQVGQVKMSLTDLNQGVELVKNAFAGFSGAMGGLKAAFIDGNARWSGT